MEENGPSNIIDYLLLNARLNPGSRAFCYLNESGLAIDEVNYSELWRSACSVARLLKEVAEPGSRIMLFFPPGLAYIKAFYGCLLAGMVAVPLYPPRRNNKSDRILRVARDCQSTIALAPESELPMVRQSWQGQGVGLPLNLFATGNLGIDEAPLVKPLQLDPLAPAFLQYTSGSTGNPKGVIITHQNIVENLKYLSEMTGCQRDDVFVNWLPLFHDLGLVTAVMWPVYSGCLSVLMAPATFVRNPIIWLEAIQRYQGTICGAPNFAYDLCHKRISEESLPAIDVSSWRIAYNAAEPVSAATIRKFSEKFSGCGFSPNAFYPSYGMAEAVVFISGGDSTTVPTVLHVDREALAANIVRLADGAAASVAGLVACGRAQAPHQIKIVNPDSGLELTEGSIGEIWFCGPSLSPGYWQLPELTEAAFNQALVGSDSGKGKYFRTGDLGFILRGELFVTGRIKDLIILRGKNYYPQDIEATVANAHASIRAGYIAAFTVPKGDDNGLVVVAELERSAFRSVDHEQVDLAIRRQVSVDQELCVDQVVLLKPHRIPVTSSGKIQRSASRALLLSQSFSDAIIVTSDSRHPYVAPKTELEQMLHGIWCDTLKVERVSTTDHFFDIGGNSLAAMEISAEISKRLKTRTSANLEIDNLLDFPTIGQLAEFLELKIARADQEPAPSVAEPRRVIRI